MRRILASALIITMLAGALVACGGEVNSNDITTAGENESVTERKDGDTTAEKEIVEDTEGKDTEGKDTETQETDSPEDPDDTTTPPALPEGEPDLTYATYDGYVMNQYNGKQAADYLAACKYYENEGFQLYSSSSVGTALSATYVSGDAYRVVMLNANKSELYIGECESGAENLPEDTSDYFELNDTTVTQHGSEMGNGMGYIIRLADGSFVIFDGGHYEDTDSSYELLCRLNGSSFGIHIRAWFITHSHGDHFRMFSRFAKTYADKVTLDALYYCAVNEEKDRDPYLNDEVEIDLAKFDGAKSFGIHTGMAFDIVDLHVQILCSPEQVYKNGGIDNFNESSVVARISTEDGSMIITGDIGMNGCNFMVDCYGEGLKSDMVQMSHHGIETATAEFYDFIKPTTVFIPCDSGLGGGGHAKQHVMQSEYAQEILVHGYGHITRALSHKAVKSDTVSLMPQTVGMINENKYIKNLEIDENGYITYDVVGNGNNLDVQFWYSLKKVDWDTTEYNAVRIVIEGTPMENNEGFRNGGGEIFFTTSGDSAGTFSVDKSFSMFQQGFSCSEEFVLIAYLGDVEGFCGETVTSLRIDIGSTGGTSVVIKSIEAFHVEVDAE